MSNRRSWLGWLMAATIVLMVLVAAALWLHERAVTRWPEQVIGWSPSPSHAMRATMEMVTTPSFESLAKQDIKLDRFSIEQLEGGLGESRKGDARIFFFIAMRAQVGDPPAIAALRLHLGHPVPARRLAALRWLTRIPDGILPDMPVLLCDPDPTVVIAALARLSEPFAAGPAPAALSDALVACVEGNPARPGVVPERNPRTNEVLSDLAGPPSPHHLMDDAMDPAPRVLDAEIGGWLDYWIREQALSDLAAWDPARAVAEVAARWPRWDVHTRAHVVFESSFAVHCGERCVPWLAGIARDPSADRKPWGVETQACVVLLRMACSVSDFWRRGPTPATAVAWEAIAGLLRQPTHRAFDEALNGFIGDPHRAFVEGIVATGGEWRTQIAGLIENVELRERILVGK